VQVNTDVPEQKNPETAIKLEKTNKSCQNFNQNTEQP
jgi:hypothetical protein